MTRLPRRFWIYLGVAAIAIAAIALSQTVFNRTPEECRPVQEMLDFNSKQSALIAEMSGGEDNAHLPTAAEQRAYVAWADGLADRAGKVTDPKLAQHAVELATLANHFVGKMAEVTAQPHAPGAPVPPAVYQMSILNDQITAQLAELSKACGS